MSYKRKKLILSLKNISLEIPIISKTEISLKKSFLKSVTGGGVKTSKYKTSVIALNSINLKIYAGERVALIGHNGAGKSSFIKLISGIYTQTKGTFKKKVHVYPMLQRSFIVSNYLTGLDAAKAHYLVMNNNLKGFNNFIEDIVSFSGLGDFIALPIRTYSEGMSSRLMFSLLTYHKHECLALDEGIGTGDASFYEKAEKRLQNFISQSGTLILASHSDALLNKFCSRGIVFSKGSIVYDGNLEDALEFYDKERH
ncbi:MAG: ABC transporter ATP-binding protein [Pelagibacteraceae bacterium TMED124]|nr:MAG: ABC transporter ATP-binding protein [Pelagibacteraceae bacterium TMED124]